MPGYRTHLLGFWAVALPALLVNLERDFFSVTPLEVAGGLLLGSVYAILPDIDTPSSKIRKPVSVACLSIVIIGIAGFLSGALDVRVLYVALAAAVVPYLLWFARHRRLYHTPAVGILFALPWYALDPVYAAFAMAGYLSHLVLDEEVFR